LQHSILFFVDGASHDKGALSPHEEEGKTKKLAETLIEGTGTDKVLIIPSKVLLQHNHP
jgi:hypothetical protein